MNLHSIFDSSQNPAIAKLTILLLSFTFALGSSLTHGEENLILDIPNTISAQSRQAISVVYQQQSHQAEPTANNTAGWKALQQRIDTQFEAMFSKPVQQLYQPKLKGISIGTIPALEVTPANWQENNKLVIYLHGGAYTRFSPRSTLQVSVPIAHDLASKVIALDYTLAPWGDFKSITGEVVEAYKALLAQGHQAKDIVFLGDSAGGGLVAGSVMRLQDENLPMPAALILWSPWVDLNNQGDTFITLAKADPIVDIGNIANAAATYAKQEHWKHPWASPIYGEIKSAFPATLIQCGTREILLSQCVRFYQKLDDGKRQVKLDIYEAMPHVFQGFFFHIEESKLARKKIKWFIEALPKTSTQ